VIGWPNPRSSTSPNRHLPDALVAASLWPRALRPRALRRACKSAEKVRVEACKITGSVMSAPEGIRTPNLLIRSQMLYPLSYGRRYFSCVPDGTLCPRKDSAEARGFEPPVPFEGDNSLAVSPIRPLWHASLGLHEGTRHTAGVPEPPEG
jgi:hypothetical protein